MKLREWVKLLVVNKISKMGKITIITEIKEW